MSQNIITHYFYHYVNDGYLNNSKFNYRYVVKFGYTSNPRQRLQSYLTGSIIRGRFDKLYKVSFTSKEEAMSYERKFHHLMTTYRFENQYPSFCSGGNEWYVFDSIEDCQSFFKVLLIDNYVDFTETFYQDENLFTSDTIINPSPIIVEQNYDRESSQQDIINKMIIHYHQYNRGILNLPTGYGKTNISLKFCLKQDYSKILILVPKLKLLSQFYDNVRKYYKLSKIYLIGCDTTSVKPNVNTIHYESTAIRNIRFDGEKYIVICVYNSSDKLKQQEFDLIIFDEAHHVATANETTSFYQFGLYDANILSKHRLFLTATVKFIKFKKNVKINDDSENSSITEDGKISMDNKEHFGDIIESISLRQAIDENICCDYKVLLYSEYIDRTNEDLVSSHSSDITSEMGQFKINQKKMNIRYEMAIKNLYNAIYDYKKQKVVLYFNKIANCKKFIQMFKEKVEKDEIWIDLVSSEDGRDSSQKENLFREFENNVKKSILCNVDIITEGVDIPNIDMIGFMDNCDSSIRIIQCMGRMLRKCGEKIGHIFIPDVVYKDEIGKGIYKKLRVLVRSLANIDYKLFIYNIIEEKLNSGLPKNENSNEFENEFDKFMVEEQFNHYNELHNKESDGFSFYPYQQCLNIVRNESWYKISDWNQKQIYCKDIRIPSKPLKIYKSDGCEDMYMFLGLEKDISKQYYQILNNLLQEFKEKNSNPSYEELVECISTNPVLYDYYITNSQLEKQKINYYIMTSTLGKYPNKNMMEKHFEKEFRKYSRIELPLYLEQHSESELYSEFYQKFIRNKPQYPKIFHMAYKVDKKD